jgi:glycosyltransferase involved in cell wall biosynthesis
MPKISIIIPVYNVEKYIQKCINSVFLQTFADFECILIDDGSSDNSGKICDEYAKKDERIKVIHQKNGGASCARNAGLDVAQGEWITFIDGDDWADENYLEQMYNNAINNNCDLSLIGYRRVEDNGNIISVVERKPLIFPSVVTYKKDIVTYTRCYVGGCWSFLYKAKLSTDLRFNIKLKVAEERTFLYFLAGRISKIVYDSTPCYNYVINRQTSVVNVKNEKFIENNKDVFGMIQYILPTEKNKFLRRKIRCFETIHSVTVISILFRDRYYNVAQYKFYRKHLLNSLFYYLSDKDIRMEEKKMAISFLFPKTYRTLKFVKRRIKCSQK